MSYYIDEHHEIYVYWKTVSVMTCSLCVLHLIRECVRCGPRYDMYEKV